MTEVLDRPQVNDQSTDAAGMDHVYCQCDNFSVSFCGRVAKTPITNPWRPSTVACVVCADLEKGPCQRCGV